MEQLAKIFEFVKSVFIWWIIVNPWESAIRVRFGKNSVILAGGCHFRIPFFDRVYIQTTRLRVLSLPPQTVTTKDGKTLTIVSAIGYTISDMYKLYETLYQPEPTLCNIVMGSTSEYLCVHDLSECSPNLIESYVLPKLSGTDFGIKFEYFKITGYAVVRTYRLIQDGHWTPDELRTNTHQ